jgi:S1-C subfamily serine protease
MDRDHQAQPGTDPTSPESSEEPRTDEDLDPAEGSTADFAESREAGAHTDRPASERAKSPTSPERTRSAWVDPHDPSSGRPALPSWPRITATARAGFEPTASEPRPEVVQAPEPAPRSAEMTAETTDEYIQPESRSDAPVNPTGDPSDTEATTAVPTASPDEPAAALGPPAVVTGDARFSDPYGRAVPTGATPAEEPALPSSPRPWFAALIGGLAGAVVATIAILGAGLIGTDAEPVVTPPITQTAQPAAQPAAQPTALDFSAGDGGISAVAARTIPSIVAIEIFASPGEPSSIIGAGSGVVYSADGLVITNSHVIEDATEVRVSLSDGRTYVAEVLGEDPVTDIAVVRIPTTAVTPIRLADMGEVAIGDLAIAIGNPLGLEGGPSVTSGVVSAFRRELEVDPLTRQTLYGLLQTDAPITRGSSGGALVDGSGALLGITTAIGVSDVGAEGLGFAVPANLAESIALDLIEDGDVRHAFLGIEGRPAFTTRDGAEVPVGAEILGLTDDSAIGDAGARTGDVIVSLHGSPVTSMNTLVAELRMFRAGDVINVGLLRDGERVDLSLTLDEREE